MEIFELLKFHRNNKGFFDQKYNNENFLCENKYRTYIF